MGKTIVIETCISAPYMRKTVMTSHLYSGYSGHVYSGHSDIVATFPSTKYIYSILFRSDIVASRI